VVFILLMVWGVALGFLVKLLFMLEFIVVELIKLS